MSKTEIAAMALAYADLSDKGQNQFSHRFWMDEFSASERQEYRRKARVVIKALEK